MCVCVCVCVPRALALLLLCCCSALYSPCHFTDPGASLLLLCTRQTPCAQPPPLLRCSTRPAPRTLTEAHTTRRRQPSEAHLRMSQTQPALLAADDFVPAVVRLRRSFWDDGHNGTEKAKRQFVLRQFPRQLDRHCRAREASSFVSWSSRYSPRP